MTFDIGLHEVCVRVGVLYVITKFSRMDSLPDFLTHGAPLLLRKKEGRELATCFSRIFERIGKIDMGRKLLISFSCFTFVQWCDFSYFSVVRKTVCRHLKIK